MILSIRFTLILLILLPPCRAETSGPPVIVEQPQDILAELDKPMALHCRAESNSLDDLRVNWYKDGRLVTMDPNARIITEFMALHVINTMPQDAGAYYCVAENSHGRTQSRIAKVQFIKLEKDFVVSPVSISASIGERVRLRCEPPHGSPSPIVYWTKNGKNLTIPLDHHDLVIPSIQSSDFASYRCIAFNGVQRQSSIAHLTEYHRPSIRLRPSSTRVDVHRGKSVDLQCQVETKHDDEQYQIEWRYGHVHGKILARNNRLEIPSVDFNHSGIYICLLRLTNAARRRHSFSEQVFLAVHERSTLNNQEQIFARTQFHAFAGRSAVLECPLPLKPEEAIRWSIVNRTDLSVLNNQRFDWNEKNQSRLIIRRVEEFDNELLFECSYNQPKSSMAKALIRVHVERLEPPPILVYVPNNQTVPSGVEVIFPCQTKEQTDVHWSFTSHHRPYKSIKIENSKKYNIESNHDLIIRHAEKTDTGIYKCIVNNKIDDETVWAATLYVEDPRSNVIFQRSERKDLPQAPTQPLAVAINSNSIELAWNHPSTDILGYSIEYFNLNSDEKHLEWKRIQTSNKNSRHLIVDLQIGSTYQFLVRARNTFGYGQPSLLSELIETRHEQQSTDQAIHLLDPINVQETSITLTWTLLQPNHIIDRLSISLITEKDQNERVETVIHRPNQTSYTITNLRPNSDYTIRLIPTNSLSNRLGRPSNSISVRTLESIPSSSPTDVQVELTSITSLSIRWAPPIEAEQNGRIIAYKVNCIGANESTSIRLLNISADAKGLHIKSLIEDMQYCVSVAARTRLGYGPYSQPICVTMNAEFLKLNRYNIQRRFHEFISQPWFLPTSVITTILFIAAILYGFWLCFHRFFNRHGHRMKFIGSNSSSSSSSSSSNQFVEMPVHKTLSNGTRYDLIKDTPPPLPAGPSTNAALWTDTIASGLRLQCCTATTASASSHSEHDHHPMNIHKNPINTLLQQSKHQQQQQQQQQQLNPYATTGIFQHYHPSVQQAVSPTILPSYTESIRSTGGSNHFHYEQQASGAVQYQPPWLDHPSSSFPYRSQPHTPYHHPYCVHCTSQSHPHTPSSIRTSARSPSTRPSNTIQMPINGVHVKTSINSNHDLRWPLESSMNSSPSVKRQSHYAPPPLIPPPPPISNSMMMNSLGGETMTTSWASSTDISHRQSISSASSITDKNDQRQILKKPDCSSSEGSIFSDSENQPDESSLANVLDQERRPSFLMPTM